MTDKQIIIDGVNVNECLFYQTNFEEDYDVKIKHYCSNWHNSCESNNNSNCYYKQLKRKEQECEQEKALKETYFTCYKAKHGDITGKLFKLKQTLIDIKDIVEENFYFLDCDYRWILEQILQKIRECEVK